MIISTSLDKTIKIWDINKYTLIKSIIGNYTVNVQSGAGCISSDILYFINEPTAITGSLVTSSKSLKRCSKYAVLSNNSDTSLSSFSFVDESAEFIADKERLFSSITSLVSWFSNFVSYLIDIIYYMLLK